MVRGGTMSCNHLEIKIDNVARIGAKESQDKVVTPSKENQVVVADSGKVLGQVNVQPIPSEYVIPSGEITITEQGTFDVAEYKQAVVTAPFDKKFAQLINGTLTEIRAEDLEGATKINNYAFNNQKYLRIVELPETVEIIGSSAFQGCSILSSINTKNIYSLEVNAFNVCSNLEELNVENVVSVGSGTLISENSKLQKLKFDKLLSGFGNYAFVSCSGLRFIKLLKLTAVGGVNSFTVYRNTYDRTYRFDSLTSIPSDQTSIPNTARVFVLNSPNVVPLSTTAHQSRIIKYVPLNLIETYKTETNWSANPDLFYPSVASEQERLALDTTLYTKCYQNDTDSEYWFENGAWVLKYIEGIEQ